MLYFYNFFTPIVVCIMKFKNVINWSRKPNKTVVEANALHCSEATPGTTQLEELSRQVQHLSAELAQLRTDSERRQTAQERSKPLKRGPVC